MISNKSNAKWLTNDFNLEALKIGAISSKKIKSMYAVCSLIASLGWEVHNITWRICIYRETWCLEACDHSIAD